MSMSVFGSGPMTLSTAVVEGGPVGIGFEYLDDEGNFDLESERLASVALLQNKSDVSTKICMDGGVLDVSSKLEVLQVECINKLESAERECIKQVNLLSTGDIEIERYLQGLQEELTDIQVMVSSNKNVEARFAELRSQVRDVSLHIEGETACDAVIIQASAGLEKDQFPFSLGMRGPSSEGTGCVVPCNGSMDGMILSSLDFDKRITVDLLVNGGVYDGGNFFGSEEEYRNVHKCVKIYLREGDIMQFRASCGADNEKSMHVIQLHVECDLVDPVEEVLRDEPKMNIENKWDEAALRNEGGLTDVLHVVGEESE